jgi:hypothetical protein
MPPVGRLGRICQGTLAIAVQDNQWSGSADGRRVP